MNNKYISIIFFIFALLHVFYIWAALSDGRVRTLDLTNIETVLIAIELILVVFVILIAIGALFGFWMIKDAAIQAAKDEANKISLKKFEEEKAREDQTTQPKFIAETEVERINYTDSDSDE